MLPGIVEKTAQDRDFIPKSMCNKFKLNPLIPSPLHVPYPPSIAIIAMQENVDLCIHFPHTSSWRNA
jgi:hypothetical protein